MEYSASVANFFDDENMEPVYDWHPRVKNIVYYGMEYVGSSCYRMSTGLLGLDWCMP